MRGKLANSPFMGLYAGEDENDAENTPSTGALCNLSFPKGLELVDRPGVHGVRQYDSEHV